MLRRKRKERKNAKRGKRKERRLQKMNLFCTCLQEVMLENVKSRKKLRILCNNSSGKDYLGYKKRNSTQKTKHKNGLSGGGSGNLHGRERKKNNMLNISTPNRPSNRERYKRSPGATPCTYDTAGRLQCTQLAVGK